MGLSTIDKTSNTLLLMHITGWLLKCPKFLNNFVSVNKHRWGQTQLIQTADIQFKRKMWFHASILVAVYSYTSLIILYRAQYY